MSAVVGDKEGAVIFSFDIRTGTITSVGFHIAPSFPIAAPQSEPPPPPKESLQSLKRVYQEPPINNEIYLKFATCFVYERCSAAAADPEAHKIAWDLFAKNVILSLKRNPVAWKRKVDAFRDTHGPINVITTGDSMPGPSMQADVKGRPEPCFMSSVIKKLRAKILDIQSNNKAKVKNELKEKKAEFLNKRDVKADRGDDKIADMKIDVESIELGCNERITEIVKSMLVGHNPRASPYFQEPAVSNVKTEVSGWYDAEATHHMSFETGHGYTENAVGVEEGNVFDLGIASSGGAEKSWSDHKAAKNVGHDTVPPELTVLGATSKEGVEAVSGGDTDAESMFLAEFMKRFKSDKRTTTTTAPGEDSAHYPLTCLCRRSRVDSSAFKKMKMPDRHCKKKASPMDTQSATAIVERKELPLAVNLSKGNLTRFEYPNLARFCPTQEEFAELGCNERITEIVKSMLVGHNPRASPYFQEPAVSNVKTEVSGNVSDLGIASSGGAEKSWSDHKAAKNVGHDTVPPESTVLGATSKEGVEAILSGDTDAKSVFLAEFVKRFKSNKRTATTTAPGEGKICYQLANLAFLETCDSSNFN
ncbi:hypothetical protein L7F22_016388 [Adiantum nelumboides]|nr:hypothetical protein [Adiantum nelumboides]